MQCGSGDSGFFSLKVQLEGILDNEKKRKHVWLRILSPDTRSHVVKVARMGVSSYDFRCGGSLDTAMATYRPEVCLKPESLYKSLQTAGTDSGCTGF